MSRLSPYLETIIQACVLFIPVAGLFTLPFMIYQYRKYGSIPVLRVLVVYAFILYSMCAFLLTVLPLPSIEEVRAMLPKPIQYIPFESYVDAFHKAGFRISEPATFIALANWKKLLTSGGLFEIIANIVMQIPLGVFLRYYFRKSWKQTLLIGMCISLFYEITQLTGLWFIYPKAYRFCSIDDLIDNTLGAMIGYWITPVLCAILPTREQLDKISIEKGRRVTLMRRLTALTVDWIIFFTVVFASAFLWNMDSGTFVAVGFFGYFAWAIAVFVIGQRLFHGKTIGKWLMRISVISQDTGKTPTVGQLLKRYTVIYLLLPLSLASVAFSMVAVVIFTDVEQVWISVCGVIVSLIPSITVGAVVIRTLLKYDELPHSHWSHTKIITHAKTDALPDQSSQSMD